MKQLVVTGLLIGACTAVQADLQACGDKFLIVTRGTRFQRAVPRASASILVFANPASNLPKALANVSVEATLRKAGYKPTTVTTVGELEAALGRGGWDLVVIDVADIRAISGHTSSDPAPVVLPVLYNVTGQELARAKKQYPAVLKSPTKSQPFLDAIDDALAARLALLAKMAHTIGN
jgi:hypothetical protein